MYAKRTSLLALGPSQDTAAAKEVNEVQKIRNLFAEFPRRDEGQTMAEYGVVLAVITIAVFGAEALRPVRSLRFSPTCSHQARRRKSGSAGSGANGLNALVFGAT